MSGIKLSRMSNNVKKYLSYCKKKILFYATIEWFRLSIPSDVSPESAGSERVS